VTAFPALLLTLAWTLPAYCAFELWARSSKPPILYSRYLDQQVKQFLQRNERSRAFLTRLQNMLAGSTLGSSLSVSQFLLLSLASGLACFLLALYGLRNPYVALLLGPVGLVLPYHLLEFDLALTKRRLRRRGASFLLTLLNLYTIYGDPIRALEQAAPQLAPPFARPVRWFVTALQHGMPLSHCIERIKTRLPDKTLNAFWDDVAYYVQFGGPFEAAIVNHVTQLYQREQLASERAVASGSTLAVFLVLAAVHLAILLGITRTHPFIAAFMVNTLPGRLVVTAMFAIYVVALWYLKTMILRDGEL